MKVDADRGKEGGEAGRSTCAIVPHALRPCLGFHRVDDFCGRPQRSPKKGAGMSPGATSLRGWHVIRLPRGVNRANLEHTSSTLSTPSFLPSSYSLYSFHRLMTRGGRKGLVAEFKSYFQKRLQNNPAIWTSFPSEGSRDVYAVIFGLARSISFWFVTERFDNSEIIAILIGAYEILTQFIFFISVLISTSKCS